MRIVQTLCRYRSTQGNFARGLAHIHVMQRSLHLHNNSVAQPPFEEHTLPRFQEKRYYPMKIGETLNDQYRILAKLGYGANSTVWLARDHITNQYACIKMFVRDTSSTSAVTNEVDVLRHISTCSNEYAELMRLPNDIFDVHGHKCLAMTPLACSLQHLQDMLVDGRVPGEFLTSVVMRLLGCINWLQLECGVVHTEITPQNVLMTSNDDAMFERTEKEELANPSVPFTVQTPFGEHPVYPSRGQPISPLETSAATVLTDFGSARLLKPGAATEGWWMPDTYRAPEILMSLPWDHGVDVWSIGVMLLELLEGRNVFDPIDRVHNQYVLPLALAQYIGYMGLPPLWMIQQSRNPVIATFFNEKGEWIVDFPIQATPFEDFVTAIPPGVEKTQFLNLIKKIFVWDPAKRANSAELCEDEWLTAPYKASGLL